LASLASSDETVRAAALRALGGLGGAGQVPLLAEKAAGGSPPERDAARQSLVRLRGADVNAALIAAGTGGTGALPAEVLGALAGRHAREALPLVLQRCGDPDRQVRLAALDALRLLAEVGETADVIRVLAAAQDAASRGKAEQALLVVANRGREQCTPAILAGLAQADATTRGALLRALGRCGGDRALGAIVARLQDEDQDVRDEALRLLSNWPDPTAVPKLTEIATQDASLRNHVLAMRGLVRLAAPEGQTAGNVPLLIELMQLARRPEEKVLVLGAAGSQASAEALKLAAAAVADPALREAAALAVVQIAEKLPAAQRQPFRAALEQVQQQAREETVRKRAEKLLAGQ
jgi:HEAT repeat protein